MRNRGRKKLSKLIDTHPQSNWFSFVCLANAFFVVWSAELGKTRVFGFLHCFGTTINIRVRCLSQILILLIFMRSVIAHPETKRRCFSHFSSHSEAVCVCVCAHFFSHSIVWLRQRKLWNCLNTKAVPLIYTFFFVFSCFFFFFFSCFVHNSK